MNHREKMKIGLVLANPPGYSETFFRSKIKGLHNNGFEITLFCRGGKTSFDLCPIKFAPKVYRNPVVQFFSFVKEYIGLISYFKRLKRYVRLERKEGTSAGEIVKKIYLNAHLLKSDVDWLHFGFSTLALGSETVAKAINARMAVSFRGFDIAVYPIKNPRCYTKLWKYVDKVHTISEGLVKLAIPHGFSTLIPVEKITPAVDIKLFTSTIHISNKNTVTFLTVGRLHWIKNYIQIIEALAILKSRNIDFIYTIIGSGQLYRRIAFTVYKLGLSNHIRFLGNLSHEEVKSHMEFSDIYIQYSYQEGFCNAVLEAQAMGKLCVVSNAEGLSENVLHKQTGWVVPKNKPELLAKQLLKVIQLPDSKKEEIAARAVERVRREFNLEKQEREFVAFYSDI